MDNRDRILLSDAYRALRSLHHDLKVANNRHREQIQRGLYGELYGPVERGVPASEVNITIANISGRLVEELAGETGLVTSDQAQQAADTLARFVAQQHRE